MYTIQNHRINLDLIAFVEIGEESLKLNGPGANIVLDQTADPNATHALLVDLAEVRGWLRANGHLMNPAHIIAMTLSEQSVKVNVAGVEIWVSDEKEISSLMNHHSGLFRQPFHQPVKDEDEQQKPSPKKKATTKEAAA